MIRNIDYLFPSSNFSFAIRTTTRISKSLGALVVTFVCIMHVFALVGVSLFGGLVNRDENRSQYEVRSLIFRILICALCLRKFGGHLRQILRQND